MDKIYCYPPDFTTLRNKFNIRNNHELQYEERRIVAQRTNETLPTGNFDLNHLRAIHLHLFQDIYDWAGKLRQINISKNSFFMPYNRLELGMSDVHNRLIDKNFFQNLSILEFAKNAAIIIGDINHIHPFREGNGRTQFQYLKQLSEQAGHRLNLQYFEKDTWIDASIQSNNTSYSTMNKCIYNALQKSKIK